MIVALGEQDIDPRGLVPPAGMAILGASSDHLVIDPGAATPAVGEALRFGLNYSALLRAMTSPFVTDELLAAGCSPSVVASRHSTLSKTAPVGQHFAP